MYEKVNPSHPDKIADRIAGAIVDLAYTKSENPKIAVEVLIGHGICHIIAESSVEISWAEANDIVERIGGNLVTDFRIVPQDIQLAYNQKDKIRCGDNGIFKGMPTTKEQKALSDIACTLYNKYGTDGKYILNGDKLIICQSHAETRDIQKLYPEAVINPLGYWSGGTDVDTGATNRKLGSDMGDAVTGGGLWGKDCSKADVSVNIYAFLKAQQTGKPVEMCCAIGDEQIDGIPYEQIVSTALSYVRSIGGFEKLSEWGLIR